MTDSTHRLVCEILAPNTATGSDLAHIATTCARETGVAVVTRVLPARDREQTLTLHPLWRRRGR